MISIVNIFLTVLLLSSCNKNNSTPEDNDGHLQLTLNGNLTQQTVHSFGASDAWSCQFVGKNWPEIKKGQIADWLFSKEFDDNNSPKGIGLTTWRFNIGGGSAQQGSASDINDEWRRAESFMTSKGVYDWDLQQGQRWFLKAAKERGVESFVGFVNSPPVSLTKNGKAYSSSGTNYNLPKENYQLYADYLSQVVKNISEKDGVDLTYISPFNEPQWDWTASGQEGSPAQNSEIYNITKIINQSFEDNNVNSLIEIPESAQLNFMYENHNKAGRGFQIYSFFNPSSPEYLGGLSHIAHKIAGHSYFSTWPLDNMVNVRKNMTNEITKNSDNLEFWMTEYCVYEDNKEVKGSGRDLGMTAALYNARVIFADLAIANASSWQWWLAVSPYDYKDGLVYIDHDKNNGDIYDSKLMWALGNYSRFIEPGMKRVVVSRSDSKTDVNTLDNIMASAYVSDDKSEATLVLVNYLDIEIPVTVTLKDLQVNGNLKMYLTNSEQENNLKYTQNVKEGGVVIIPAKSVVTISNVE